MVLLERGVAAAGEHARARPGTRRRGLGGDRCHFFTLKIAPLFFRAWYNLCYLF